MPNVPLADAYGEATPYVLEVEPAGDDVRLRISADFAGREVDEEIPRADLERLIQGEEEKNEDLLGLVLVNGEDEIHGLIGVGSGNERFRVKREDLAAALTPR